MGWEGQQYSWVTSVYWTVVTMSTLGYGDVVFSSSLGQIFSLIVLLSGSAIILVLLPFTFIQFVFTPWMEKRERERTPKKVPDGMEGHIIFTRLGAIEEALIQKCRRVGKPYVIVEESFEQAGLLHDAGYSVVIGSPDSVDTYRNLGIERAALLVTSHGDAKNANVTFTAKEVSNVPVVATVASKDAVDVLELAGADKVLRLGNILGEGFASRLLQPTGAAHIVAENNGLFVAEATVVSSLLAGKSIVEAGVREQTGCSVVGMWHKGEFEQINLDTLLVADGVVLVAGTQQQLDVYSSLFSVEDRQTSFVVIIGCGRVGSSLSRKLSAAKIHHSVIDIVEQRARRVESEYATIVVGEADDIATIEKAGISKASAAVVTTHDDDVNVYLTLYINKLRAGIEILARAHQVRNIKTLYRAGADMVLSYGSVGAEEAWRCVNADKNVFLAEDLELFYVKIPAWFKPCALRDVEVFQKSRCTVLSILGVDGVRRQASSGAVLSPSDEIMLLGNADSADVLYGAFAPTKPKAGKGRHF